MSSSFVKDCSDASAPASSNSMNSSCVPAAGSSAGNKTVFIIVNDSHIDQEQLSSILANHADASSEVSVLQMASGGGGLSAASDTPDPRPASGALSSGASQQQSYQDSLNTIPLESGEASGSSYSELALDAESLHQLESVLCTDEARHLLASDNLLDILTAAPNSSGSSGSSVGASSVSTSTAGADAGGTRPSGRGRGRAPPKRRSQRQQDKAEREEVTKILAENQRMLQREREELMAADGTGSQASVTQRELSNQQGEGTADEQHSEQEESEDDDDRSSDDGEQEDDDDENDKEVEMKKDQALKNARPVTARVAKTATRGRGRPRKYQSVALSGSGRGRGAPEAESGARGAPGAFKPGSLRGPRGRGRGRGMARGSKGKHMPVMVQEEEDDDDELPELSGPSGAPVASKATREGGSAVPAA